MYITHCSEYQLNQTKWHASYESLYFIKMLVILFYTIIMNFILILFSSSSLYKYDNLLTVINKFSKQVLLLFSKFIYTVSDWANVLFLDLIDHDWDIFHQIINDCDQRFLSFFWQVLFNKLDTKLLTFMIYHSQMNDQFKCTN